MIPISPNPKPPGGVAAPTPKSYGGLPVQVIVGVQGLRSRHIASAVSGGLSVTTLEAHICIHKGNSYDKSPPKGANAKSRHNPEPCYKGQYPVQNRCARDVATKRKKP